MSDSSNVEFSTNFRGIGLPADIYSDFVTLFRFISNDTVTCDNVLDGTCYLPGPCANYTAFNDFSFMVEFDQATYMRVPLATFANEIKYSLGQTVCNIQVTYLDSLSASSQNIIMGGLFYQEFAGYFSNGYADPYNPTQMAKFYVGQNSKYNQSYIGNETLPTGTNPFVPGPTPPGPEPPGPEPPSPTPDEPTEVSAIWIVLLVIVGALLLGFLGFAIYRWKIAQSRNANRQLVYNDNNAETQRLNQSEGLTSRGD